MKDSDFVCYPAVFTYEEGKEISVEFPDLDVATCGENEADAVKMAKELLGITIIGLEEDEENIPTPSKLSDVICEKGQRTALIEVFMPSIREAANNKAVTRTITLPAWLNAKAIEHKVNFSLTLKNALLDQLGLR